jgi:ATP-binding cassette subfamily B protein
MKDSSWNRACSKEEVLLVLKRLIRYLKPHRRRFFLAFGILLLATAADVSIPVLVSRFIDNHLVPRNLNETIIFLYAGAYLFLQISHGLLQYYQLFSFHRIAQWVIQQIRQDLFSKVQHLGLSYFDRTPTGSLVSRMTNDTEAIKDLYVAVLSTFISHTVFLIGTFVALFALDVTLALWSLLVLPIVLVLMRVYQKYSSKAYHYVRQKLSQMNAQLSESLQAMNIIQAFRQEQRLREQFAKMNEEHYQGNMRTVKLFGLLLRPAVYLLKLLFVAIFMLSFGILSFSESVKVGVIFGFITLFMRMFEPINEIMMQLSRMQQSLVAAERVFKIMDETEYAPQKVGDDDPKITEGRIEFRNVTFSYDGKVNVLKNISFVAEPGQTVALVGHTGSGKSSIINLLLRFYPLQHGEILIDGQPLSHFRDEELRKKIGLVLQDPFLFYGDIKSNIRLHNEEITDEQIIEAAKFVQADEFIRKLPRQYDEPVGERGATFSSGQRQLIAFARTMAIQPKILVLDEATANIDTETEEAIQIALDKMRKGRTTIAIAHRLSTIQDADLILVLHRGEIVERGTHQELLAKKGLYYKMYLLQKKGSELAVSS